MTRGQLVDDIETPSECSPIEHMGRCALLFVSIMHQYHMVLLLSSTIFDSAQKNLKSSQIFCLKFPYKIDGSQKCHLFLHSC
jgi:hypothetical protein